LYAVKALIEDAEIEPLNRESAEEAEETEDIHATGKGTSESIGGVIGEEASLTQNKKALSIEGLPLSVEEVQQWLRGIE